ncbi:uncharacterized protein LOC120339239 isoform X1 [Styela clava]
MSFHSKHMHSVANPEKKESPLNTHHPQVGASFVEVTYGGDKRAIVNTDCAIVHLLLHLRAKCIGDGFAISDNICIEGSLLPSKKHQAKTHKLVQKGNQHDEDDDDEIEYLDLLDGAATPLELSNRDPLSFATPYLKHRSEYVLCSVKKTKEGYIKDANPLLVKPSMDLKRRIHTVLRTMERFKSRGDKQSSPPTKVETRRKGHKKGGKRDKE